MNPEIDLSAFRKETEAPAPGPPGSARRPLVAPPRRLATRYVLPGCLLLAFAGVAAYALRDSLTPAVPVRVVLPALVTPDPAGGATGSDTGSGSDTGTDSGANASGRSGQAEAGAPLFQAPGWIEPSPLPTDLSASTPGIVSRIHVLEGQRVSSGTVVAELVDDDARLQVRRAEAELNLKRAEYEAALANWEHPLSLKEAVRQARAEKERLEAEKARARQTVELARREQEQSSRLASKGATGAYAAQKAALETRAAELSLLELDARIRSAAAALETAEERLRLRIEDRNRLAIARAEMEAAEAALEEARYRLSQRRVVAATSGTVMRLYAGEGAPLSMDRPEGLRIASIYQPDRLQVRADVPLAEAARVSAGLPAEIRVEALPDRVFRGEVVRIVHEADPVKNTLPVKVRILDPDPALKPEMIARLQFLAPAASPARVGRPAARAGTGPLGAAHMPKAADAGAGLAASPTAARVYIPAVLAPGESGAEVALWVAGADGRAHRRTVTLGRGRRGELREVVAGLALPDKIIASNLDQLQEGCRIRIAAME